MSSQRGTLYLVVGPSGSGKDSLIDGAKAALVNDDQYVFPRRYITRSAKSGGENHIPVSSELFAELLAGNKMILSWPAHGLQYGIPASVEDDLAAGRHVVLNVSRTIVDQARVELAPVEVIYITVDEDVLTQRLQARGRETMADIKRRVARASQYKITGNDVHIVDNGGPLKKSISDFLQAMQFSTLI
ncbi:MAG: phosphonate metabolism protein/1,5-bisphosphokinase (PRPP-forming) PhnN [Magnetovibrio sp.]|nr:phosphonate metabolism protein/1,5-bisphosphokinase (PRPP-forming) PhnN [Magnetovibrio sp.]